VLAPVAAGVVLSEGGVCKLAVFGHAEWNAGQLWDALHPVVPVAVSHFGEWLEWRAVVAAVQGHAPTFGNGPLPFGWRGMSPAFSQFLYVLRLMPASLHISAALFVVSK
jgi:hypothetical protein